MSDAYRFLYEEGSVYEHVVDVVNRNISNNGSVFVDLGCGFGAIAEPIQEMGLTYLGFDSESSGLDDLRKRGFEASSIDLTNPQTAVAAIDAQLNTRVIAGIAMLDVLEHLVVGEDLLVALRDLAFEHHRAPLFLSVPNVAHIDIASKLLVGRWDVTETGLLDRTHVTLYTSKRLDSVTQESGWQQTDQNDFALRRSDQYFPKELASLSQGTSLNQFLEEIRSGASSDFMTNQFVRCYIPTLTTTLVRSDDREPYFLSVLMRTQGRRMPLMHDSLLSLAAQTSQDFEVIVLAHDVTETQRQEIHDLVACFSWDGFGRRVRIVPVIGGGRSRPLNVGLSQAAGEYVTVLDDDDVVFAHWVDTFVSLADRGMGKVLRSVCAEQKIAPSTWPSGEAAFEPIDAPTTPWSVSFDLFEHLSMNQSPSCSYAVPRSCFTDLGISYDEDLPVVEDWDVLLQAAILCGVEDSRLVTSLYRRWSVGESSSSIHIDEEWDRAMTRITEKLDRRPLLLPPRSLSSYRRLTARNDELAARLRLVESQTDKAFFERDRASTEVQQLLDSTSRLWRECELLRQRNSALNERLTMSEGHATTIEQMIRSRSWRVTRPIRFASTAIKRILGRRESAST